MAVVGRSAVFAVPEQINGPNITRRTACGGWHMPLHQLGISIHSWMERLRVRTHLEVGMSQLKSMKLSSLGIVMSKVLFSCLLC